jgi:hypothetical protein
MTQEQVARITIQVMRNAVASLTDEQCHGIRTSTNPFSGGGVPSALRAELGMCFEANFARINPELYASWGAICLCGHHKDVHISAGCTAVLPKETAPGIWPLCKCPGFSGCPSGQLGRRSNDAIRHS